MPPPKLPPCPGCATPTRAALLSCETCWKRIPGVLKARLSATEPNTSNRRRSIADMRKWLAENKP